MNPRELFICPELRIVNGFFDYRKSDTLNLSVIKICEIYRIGKMRRSVTKAVAMLMVFGVMFSGMPYLAGSLDVHAATSKKKITLKATVTGQTEVKLKWNKIKKPGKGYAVFRDGKAIKYLGKKKTSFSDRGLEPGAAHKYQIKTYTKKKVTKWYNKKTKKWQTKKPARKYRGKSKKVTKYTYKKRSNAVTVQTSPPEDGTKDNPTKDPTGSTSDGGAKDSSSQDPTDNTSDSEEDEFAITWKNWDGAVLRTDTVDAGSMPSYGSAPARPADALYSYTFTGWSPVVTTANGNATYTATYSSHQNVSTPGNVQYSIDNDGYPKITWTSVSGATDYKVYRTLNGTTNSFTAQTNSYTDTSAAFGKIYEYYVVALKDSYISPNSASLSVPVPERKTVINYTGRTYEIFKYPNENVWRYASNDVEVESMARIDKTVDGEFDTNEGHMIQYHGATFNATQIDNIKPDNYHYTVQMYNGDASKFSIDLEDGVYIDGRNTFKETGNHVYEPITKYYYFKNGHPIAMPHTTDGKFVYKTETSDNITKKHFIVINAAMSVGDALGIWTDTFDVYVKYDGKIIRTITIDTTRDEYYGTNWTVQTANGMSPWRRVALDIADQAIAAKGGSTGNLNRDLRLIGDYIEETYTYGEQVSVQDTYMDMKCLAGAIVLETYSVYRFGKYGFESSGSNYASGTHSAFNLDEDPRTYYEANGRLN